MKNFLLNLTFIFSCVLLVCCHSSKPLEPETIHDTKTIVKTVRDTVIRVEADSSFYNAWIECRNGKPVLREPENTAPKQTAQKPDNSAQSHKRALALPTVRLGADGKLNVECRKEVELITAQLASYYESKLQEHTKPVYIEKPFKWYQKGLMWLGGLFLAIIAIAGVLRFKN